MSAGRIQQQDITTFAQAAAEAQREPGRRRPGRSGKPGRMPVCLSRLAWAGTRKDGVREIALNFHDAGGPAVLEGRALVVTMTYAEISQALGSIPAGSVPKNITEAMTAVRRWLESEERS